MAPPGPSTFTIKTSIASYVVSPPYLWLLPPLVNVRNKYLSDPEHYVFGTPTLSSVVVLTDSPKTVLDDLLTPHYKWFWPCNLILYQPIAMILRYTQYNLNSTIYTPTKYFIRGRVVEDGRRTPSKVKIQSLSGSLKGREIGNDIQL